MPRFPHVNPFFPRLRSGHQFFHRPSSQKQIPAIKSNDLWVRETWQLIDNAHLDRHSYLLAIGGGAFLDAIGYAAATAHRGVRLIRFPAPPSPRDDSGVGVKCAINAFGKKNWIGSFAVPFAVINDFRYLHTQPENTRLAGLIEAIKVALVKDGAFFEWIESQVPALRALEPAVLESCVEKSGLRSIRSTHPRKAGIAPASLAARVLKVLDQLGLPTYHPGLDWSDEHGKRRIFEGLHEFREHLGGELTVLMLQGVGQSLDVHQIDLKIMADCIEELKERSRQ